MSEKEKILAKFNMKDYRNDLETILENKQFDEEAKSLLLNIFYKIDNFYKDYSAVKKEIEHKNKFLENFLNIIKNKCKKIEILSPQQVTKTKKYEIDKVKGEIKSFPNENILMLAVFELAELRFSKEIDFTNKCILDMLNKGNTINSIEPIRDFNGWSWNVEINNTKNIEYNLIFQNLLILFGYDFVSSNVKNYKVLNKLKLTIIDSYKKEGTDFLDCLLQIAIILYNNNSLKNHRECLKNKEIVIENINTLSNRKEYINNVTKNNTILITKIQKMDLFLNDINAIRKEFNKSIDSGESSYFCLSDFVEFKENEKEKLVKQLENNNKSLSPREYLKHQDENKRILKLYENIKEEPAKINISSKIIKLQRLFLECLRIKIGTAENKKELYAIATQLRYYANIPYGKYKSIIMQDKIAGIFNEVEKELINKMIENKIIDLGFKNRKLNYQIVKYIFKSKIMKLDSVILKISFITNKELEVEYYDGNMLEHKEVFEVPFDEDVVSMKTRKVRLFKVVS